MEGLRDIKPFVPIVEPSFWWFLATLGGGALLLGLLIFLFIQFVRRKKTKSPREVALEALAQLTYADAKQAAYGFTEWMEIAVDETHAGEFASIRQELEAYKFKKSVPPLDDKLKARMQHLIEAVRHG